MQKKYKIESNIEVTAAAGNLKATINSKASSSGLSDHANNSDIHVTLDEKTTWNSKQTALGFAPVNKAGDTMTGSLIISPGKEITIGSVGHIRDLNDSLDIYSDQTTISSSSPSEHTIIDGTSIPKNAELATKEDLHSHTNKGVLDAISQADINSWNAKSDISSLQSAIDNVVEENTARKNEIADLKTRLDSLNDLVKRVSTLGSIRYNDIY